MKRREEEKEGLQCFVEVLIIKKYMELGGKKFVIQLEMVYYLFDLRINAGNVDLKITSWRTMIGTVSTF